MKQTFDLTDFSPGPGNCVTFGGFDLGPLPAEGIAVGWMRIRALNGSAYIGNFPTEPERGQVLRFGGGHELQIRLDMAVSSVTVDGVTGVSTPVVLQALPASGIGIIDEQEITSREIQRVVLQSDLGIWEVRATAIEGDIYQICAGPSNPDDFASGAREREEQVRQDRPEVGDEYNRDPDLYERLINEAILEASQLYQGGDSAREIVIGWESSIGGIYIPPLVIKWPPPWGCVARNIAVVVALTVALTYLASALEVGTIAELTAEQAIPILAQFGIEAEAAVGVLSVLGAGLIVAQAIDNCS